MAVEKCLARPSAQWYRYNIFGFGYSEDPYTVKGSSQKTLGVSSMSSTDGTVINFMQRKWRNWFKVLDVNRDGTLSKQDYKDCLYEFENYYRSRVDEHSLADMTEGLRQFWEVLIFRKKAHKDIISSDEFVSSLTEEFQSDPEGLRQLTRRIMTLICKALDVDHNGFLSYDEFAITFRAFGTKDESLIQKTNQEYHPSEKGIELAGFIESWIDLAVGEDETKESLAVKRYLSKV